MADAPFYLQEPVDPITKLGLANYLQAPQAVPATQGDINQAVMNQPMPQMPAPQRAPAQVLKGLQKYLPPKPMAKAASNEQIDAYTGLSEKSLADQQATLAGLNQYIDSIAQKPQGINLTPVAAFIDSFTGSKLAPAAQALAPMNPDDRDKMLFGLRNQLAVGQEKLSNDRLQAAQYAQNMRLKMEKDAEDRRHNLVNEANQAARGDGMSIRALTARDNQSIAVGKDIEHNEIIKDSKKSLNSLTRAVSILENPNKPVTAKDLNLSYNDFINSVAAGGAATEGKIARELPHTYAQALNEINQNIGNNVDMRDSAAGRALINMLRENVRTVRGDLNGAIRDQINLMEASYTGVEHNPGVMQTFRNKKQQYEDYLNKQDQGHGEAKVRVSNGKETRLIDPKHLKDAAADGYQQVK